MTTYNTGNPVGSPAVKDLFDNAENFDEAVNGSSSTWIDRLGNTRKAWASIENSIDAVEENANDQIAAVTQNANQSIDQTTNNANAIIAGLGYQVPVPYEAGIDLSLANQTVSYDGKVYAPISTDLPFTTSGTFESEKFRLIQGVASVDLSAGSGAAMVGYDGDTVQAVLDEAKPMQSYTALRNYTGRAKGVRITQPGIAGIFQVDTDDGSSEDDGGITIVDGAGRRWKRLYDGAINVRWFGAVGDGVTDNLAAISAAIAAANGRTILVPVGEEGGDYAVKSGTLTIPDTARFKYEAGARIYADGGTISDSGRHLYLFGGGENEGLADGLTRGIGIELNGGNSGTAPASTLKYNRLLIVDDRADAAPDENGTKVDGLLVSHSFGGEDCRGGRHAVEAVLTQADATESDNPDRNYVASVGICSSASGDGGTSSTVPSNAKGSYFGGNFYGRLLSGALNTFNITAAEFNSVIASGASTYYRSGIQIVGGGDVRGDGIDAGLSISNFADAGVTWRNAIRIGNMNGGQALGPDSKVLAALSDGKILGGVQMPECTDFVLQSGDVTLTNKKLTMAAPGSALEIGSTSVAETVFIDLHSSGNDNDYDARISASGGSASPGGGTLQFTSADAAFSSRVRPLTDNSVPCGAASYRWSQIYASSGTISTSDARQKTNLRAFTDSEISAAQELANETGIYQWIASVEEKGADGARQHVGMTVQRAIEIMRKHDLDPFRYGFICYDQWDDVHDQDEKGQPVLILAAGDRYSFRMSQLLAFILRGVMARQDQIEARLDALEQQ